MKLLRFTVTNFRSIIKAHNIPISNTTVIVGKNNEGKSNLLKALSISMNIISEYSKKRYFNRLNRNTMSTYSLYRMERMFEGYYEWQRDFPIALQNKSGQKNTIFKLEFELTTNEIESFRKEIKSNLNGHLRLEITIGENNKPKIKVLKQGRGNELLNKKSDKITEYISQKISFNYIPAIRTHEQTVDVIKRLLSKEMAILEENEEYKKSRETILNIEKTVLKELSKRITVPLSKFLPNIKSVKIHLNEEDRYVGHRRDFNLVIDDGTPTNIEYKGEGVKSLAALGILKDKNYKTDASIIAIEEPESHLHPGAIHQLQEIIRSLENENQVVLTTHNPLFVNRASLNSNIIINTGKAIQAKNINEIRKILGVRISDNLMHAQFCLIVEGKQDKNILEAIIPHLSKKLGNAFKNHILVIETLNGVANLSYKLSSLAEQLYTHHVFVDHNNEANAAIEKAIKDKILERKDLTQTICRRMEQSELEDCFDYKIYASDILKEFNVDINCAEFKKSKKWSDRIESTFSSQGKKCTHNVIAQVKNTVAATIIDNVENALCEHKKNSITSLVDQLENLIDSRSED